jgi:hypothetical protein
MAYSDFTLKKAKSELGLEFIEGQSLFENLEPIAISSYLEQTLKRNVPLALAINSEKARSELIIINVLLEIKTQLHDKISLFSGIDFTVDKEKGLNGFCDYIISLSKEQLYLESPVIAIVEAKNENIVGGLGQCIAEMVAAQQFNQQEGKDIPVIYGIVTSGNEWKFLKLAGRQVFIDSEEYHINNVDMILGIMMMMIRNVRIT